MLLKFHNIRVELWCSVSEIDNDSPKCCPEILDFFLPEQCIYERTFSNYAGSMHLCLQTVTYVLFLKYTPKIKAWISIIVVFNPLYSNILKTVGEYVAMIHFPWFSVSFSMVQCFHGAAISSSICCNPNPKTSL